MTMTKAGLVKIICEKMGFALKESTEIVEKVFAIMKETLEPRYRQVRQGFRGGYRFYRGDENGRIFERNFDKEG